jgi:hypothetical protein
VAEEAVEGFDQFVTALFSSLSDLCLALASYTGHISTLSDYNHEFFFLGQGSKKNTHYMRDSITIDRYTEFCFS